MAESPCASNSRGMTGYCDGAVNEIAQMPVSISNLFIITHDLLQSNKITRIIPVWAMPDLVVMMEYLPLCPQKTGKIPFLKRSCENTFIEA
jgi:hypothetical protein